VVSAFRESVVFPIAIWSLSFITSALLPHVNPVTTELSEHYQIKLAVS